MPWLCGFISIATADHVGKVFGAKAVVTLPHCHMSRTWVSLHAHTPRAHVIRNFRQFIMTIITTDMLSHRSIHDRLQVKTLWVYMKSQTTILIFTHNHSPYSILSIIIHPEFVFWRHNIQYWQSMSILLWQKCAHNLSAK